jgi:hypothetical protein
MPRCSPEGILIGFIARQRHGRLLQGQALWQLRDDDAHKRAPAHDESGHTWQHSDEELFHITKYGRFESTPPERVSFMPAFKNRLTDDQILAIIAFIKRGWPIGLRASQATLNPGYPGMPPEASRVAWKSPPTCRAALEQRGVKSVDQTLAPGPGLVVEGFGERPQGGRARRDPAWPMFQLGIKQGKMHWPF